MELYLDLPYFGYGASANVTRVGDSEKREQR